MSTGYLRGRRIALGVGGGIAAYKVADLLRKLVEAGNDVRVIPTAAALQFVGAPTWAALSHHRVTSDVWSDADEVPHRACPGHGTRAAEVALVYQGAPAPAPRAEERTPLLLPAWTVARPLPNEPMVTGLSAVGEPLTEFRGVLTGVPQYTGASEPLMHGSHFR